MPILQLQVHYEKSQTYLWQLHQELLNALTRANVKFTFLGLKQKVVELKASSLLQFWIRPYGLNSLVLACALKSYLTTAEKREKLLKNIKLNQKWLYQPSYRRFNNQAIYIWTQKWKRILESIQILRRNKYMISF